jgi:hypothetical protein
MYTRAHPHTVSVSRLYGLRGIPGVAAVEKFFSTGELTIRKNVVGVLKYSPVRARTRCVSYVRIRRRRTRIGRV